MFGRIAQSLMGSANERLMKGPRAGSRDDQRASSRRSKPYPTKRSRHGRAGCASGWLAAKSLDDLLYDAFATVREAAKRTLGQRHYDVQLMGGMVLHRGMIAEMKTGEGKTLVATLPVYLNGARGQGRPRGDGERLSGRARPRSGWARSTNSSACPSAASSHGLTDSERLAAYAADVTYGTNNEFGFDYLRDNT